MRSYIYDETMKKSASIAPPPRPRSCPHAQHAFPVSFPTARTLAQLLEALEGHLKLERAGEHRRVVQDNDVGHVDGEHCGSAL